jgi:RHS repeat-associated protein
LHIQCSAVWQWDNSDPFGNNLPNENPAGQGAFNFNLRFAGQYFDRETNTHYNINRDYDPSIGRYIESDPIGLAGGINTFGYANQNPLSFSDPFGLASSCGSENSAQFPNEFPGFSFESSCKNHDDCYDTCGKTKTSCDAQFLRDMLTECSRIPILLAIVGGQSRNCRNLAITYSSAVVTRGGDAYQDAQKSCKGCK